MRVSRFQAISLPVRSAARHAALGALAGWGVLAICLSENASDLGYAVLAGGFSTLLTFAAAFGLAGAVLGAAASLAAHWYIHEAGRTGVARLQLARSRVSRQVHRTNQALR